MPGRSHGNLCPDTAGLSGARTRSRAELKTLVPGDAHQAIGHGVRAKRSKSGAITFELLKAEDDHAAVQ